MEICFKCNYCHFCSSFQLSRLPIFFVMYSRFFNPLLALQKYCLFTKINNFNNSVIDQTSLTQTTNIHQQSWGLTYIAHCIIYVNSTSCDEPRFCFPLLLLVITPIILLTELITNSFMQTVEIQGDVSSSTKGGSLSLTWNLIRNKGQRSEEFELGNRLFRFTT